MLNLVILETNELTQLTLNSIEKNMEGAAVTVVPCPPNKKIRTALENITETSLVVCSGLVLNINDSDIPPAEILSNYSLCCSRAGVYTDHKGLRHNYKVISKDLNKSHIDLSIFIINPDKWDELPESDKGVLNDQKILYMPRYMNHKSDVTIATATSAYTALQYGALGLDAAVHNYVGNILTGEALVDESYAYNFDILPQYAEGLDEKYIKNIHKLEQKTKRISKFRDKYNQINKD